MLKVEEKQLKRLQSISKVIGVLSFAAFIILLVFLGYTSYTVNQQITTAENELANKNLEINGKQTEIEKLDKELANKKELVNAQANAIQDISKDTTKATIKKVIENNPIAAKALPRVYLHIADESEKPAIQKVSEKLQIGGYIVPKVEIVGRIAPKENQLRYCQGKERSNDLANIQQLLKEINVAVKLVPIPDWIDCSDVEDRNYEFWLESNKPQVDVKKPVIKKP